MTSLTERNNIISLVADSIDAGARQRQCCKTIELSERTLQRWQSDANSESCLGDRRPSRIQIPKNALTPAERERILTVANLAEFAHLSPSQIVPCLLDQACYIASESSFYRVLRAAKQLAHRGKERPAQARRKPRALCATEPNQLFSWDITYLPTHIKGIHYYLYLFIDIFSRKVVGWQIYENESSELASEVMIDICAREDIAPNQVILHSDNGSPMKGATMLATLQQLGVVPSFSRPAVSNDNPYSESFFKTLKYRPSYPQQAFANLLEARVWVGGFVQWYNQEHRHSAINFVTPAQRHTGEDHALLAKRVAIYKAAKEQHPARWSGEIRNWQRINIVHLNPEKNIIDKEQPAELKNAA